MSRQQLLVGLVLLVSSLSPVAARAQLVAEQVTAPNAGIRLFGGSDADGGIGDWYVSNGVIEAIVDDVGPQDDLVGLLGASAPPKQSEAAFTGGSLIDLGIVGADNDQLSQMFTVGGLSTSNFILYDSISGSTTATTATITATGSLLGFSPIDPSDLAVATEYTVTNSDTFLTITTTVTNNDATNTASGLGGFLDAFIWTQRSIVPFSPLVDRGFNHPDLDLGSLGAALEFPTYAAGPAAITPADGVMDPPSGTVAGEVSYGLLGVDVSVDQGGGPVVAPVDTLFGINTTLVTALGNLPAGSLDPGGVLVYTRRVYVGDRNDVASSANAMITALGVRRSFGTGTISGDVDAADTTDVTASVIATKTGGPSTPGFVNNSPVTHFRTDASGAFSGIVLPEGTYDLEVRAVERDTVVVSGVTVTSGGNTPVAVPPMTGLGAVELSVFEKLPGPDPTVPAKVTFKGVKDTPDPAFKKDFDAFAIPTSGPNIDLLPESFAGGPAQGNIVYLADGTATVQLRPGKYEIYASRGPEYTVKRKRVRIKEGVTRKRKLKIRRIVDTSGAISGDFHIHSARSFDTQPPLRDRVASFAGVGVEVMVSTDHDYHVDYSSIISSLGLGSLITSMVGNEITGSVPNPPIYPDSIGHINAWPLPVEADERRDGSIEDEYVAPNFIYHRVRAQLAEVVQYNHPRAGVSGLTSIGFFNNIGYDPTLPIDSSPNDLLLDDDITGSSGVPNPSGYRNIDFDVMEIGNGTSIPGYIATRRDWLSLLNQLNTVTASGTVPFIAGTAVSDSHRITVENPGYFRTYVRGAGDDPASFTPSTFNANVRAGNMLGTTGPYIEFAIEEDGGGASAGLGGTLVPATSDVVLKIRVQATNWIPVEEVRIIANGFVIDTFDMTTSPAVTPGPNNPRSQSPRKVVRFDADIPMSLVTDTYFLVEAGAPLSPLPSSPEFVDIIEPDMVPLGFTNPIFVDLAGDGFDPPGLPVMTAAAGGEQLPLPKFARVVRRDEPLLTRVGRWWRRLTQAVAASDTAEAADEETALTGNALTAEVDRQKAQPSVDYFPLHRFRIPESAVEDAIDRLPEPERSSIRAQRARTGAR